MNNIITRDLTFPDDVEDTRTVQFIISDDSKDRHGSVLNMDNWNLENFNRNGIVGYQHDVYGGGFCLKADPDDVIGTGRAFFEQKGGKKVLIGEVKFEPEEINPLAEKIFRKVLHGTLKATSVGFIPIKDENGSEGRYGRENADGDIVDENTFYYYGQELLEFSIVNIPSNPNAVGRSLRDQTANAIHFIKRELGKDFSYSDIEQMKVRDVLDLLETSPDERVNQQHVEENIDGNLTVTFSGYDTKKIKNSDGLFTIDADKLFKADKSSGFVERKQREGYVTEYDEWTNTIRIYLDGLSNERLETLKEKLNIEELQQEEAASREGVSRKLKLKNKHKSLCLQ